MPMRTKLEELLETVKTEYKVSKYLIEEAEEEYRRISEAVKNSVNPLINPWMDQCQAAEKERDELQHEYDDAENSAIAVIGELRAEVERLALACANAVPMAALQAEEAESERLSQRVRDLEALIQLEARKKCADCNAASRAGSGTAPARPSKSKRAGEWWHDTGPYQSRCSAEVFWGALHQPPAPQPEEPKHVCGLTGYNPMKGDSCPACAAPGLDGRELYWLKAKISEPVYVSCADENCIGCEGVHLKPSEPASPATTKRCQYVFPRNVAPPFECGNPLPCPSHPSPEKS